MGFLFSDGQLSVYLHQHDVALHDEVEATPDEHVLQAHVDGWADALAEAYARSRRLIRAEDLWGDPPESRQFDLRHDSASRLIIDPGQPVLAPGTFVRVHVPFDGDGTTFLLTASARSFNPPEAEVKPGELIFELAWPNDRPRDPRAHVENELERIEKLLVTTRADCEAHSRGLAGYARAQIERRRDAIRATRSALEGRGIPVRASGGGGKRRMHRTYSCGAPSRGR